MRPNEGLHSKPCQMSKIRREDFQQRRQLQLNFYLNIGFSNNNDLTWGNRKRVFSGSSVVGDENYHQYQLWAGLSWISELLFIKYWRGNTDRGAQTSSILSYESGPLLHLYPRTAPWWPSRLRMLGLPGGRVEPGPRKKKQLHILHIFPSHPPSLCPRLSPIKDKIPGAARWKLKNSVRIFRYWTWQIIL